MNIYMRLLIVFALALMMALPAYAQGVDNGTSSGGGGGGGVVTQPTGTNLHMVCDSGCSSSTAPADESAFTFGTTSQSPVGGFFQTTATLNPLSTGQMGAMQLTANRALFVNLRTATGTEIGTSGSPVQVSLANTAANATAVTVGQATGTNLHIVCDSGCSSSTAPADQATFVFGTTSQSPVGGFFQTTATSNPLTTGKMGAFQVTAQRALFVNPRDSSGVEIVPATSALQTTGNANLSTIATNTTGVATASNQVTANTSLATIAANTGAAIPTGTNPIGLTGQTNGDPCTTVAHVFTPINISSAANTKIVAGTSAKKTYICHLFLFAAAADNVGIVEGSGTNCATSPLGLIGGNTAATGINLAANQGFESGHSTNAIAASTVNANDFCLITSASSQLSGVAVTVSN